MPRVSIAPLRRVTRDGSRTDQDLVAVEAPLSIQLSHTAPGATAPTLTSLGIFMRTPGDDEAFVLGLLYAEGVIRSSTDVTETTLAFDSDEASATLRVVLAPHVMFDPAVLARSGVATTACGLCGKLSALSNHVGGRFPAAVRAIEINSIVFQLPHRLRDAQAVFAKTGGLHAAAFFDRRGVLVDITEDVGRHNAVDKLIGRALLAARGRGTEEPPVSPAGDHLLVVSGRVAYEIIQKAAMAGVGTLVAVGAPSSLAVQAARETGITLIGFAKDGSYNVYG